MQTQKNMKLKKVDTKKLFTLDKFFGILWIKEVEYKIKSDKAFLKEISYVNSNKISNYTFYFSLIF